MTEKTTRGRKEWLRREDRCVWEQRRRRRKVVNNLQDEWGGSGAEQRCVFVTAAAAQTQQRGWDCGGPARRIECLLLQQESANSNLQEAEWNQAAEEEQGTEGMEDEGEEGGDQNQFVLPHLKEHYPSLTFGWSNSVNLYKLFIIHVYLILIIWIDTEILDYVLKII